MTPSVPIRVNVVGAGAFGGWTALALARAGCRVTLVEAWSPGHSRASSGDETRVLRHAYGERAHYVPLVRRALSLWRDLEQERGARLFRPSGVLWLLRGDAGFERDSARELARHGLPHEWLDRRELSRRYPAFAVGDLDGALLEHEAGALFARRGCEVVAEAAVAAGVTFVRAAARPPHATGGRLGTLALDGHPDLGADVHVFACGPWLPTLFPAVLAPRLTVTRQELFAFGLPPGDTAHHTLPVWADRGETFWYGIPDGLRGAFKLGEDTHGPRFDPTDGDRVPAPERLARARAYLAHRFPGLAGAPLVDGRVCQYTMTSDAELLLTRHPGLADVWLVGGGSGHGYKLGPAVGELTARAIVHGEAPDPRFGLAR